MSSDTRNISKIENTDKSPKYEEEKYIASSNMIEWIEVYLQSEWYSFVSNKELDVDPKAPGCLRNKKEVRNHLIKSVNRTEKLKKIIASKSIATGIFV